MSFIFNWLQQGVASILKIGKDGPLIKDNTGTFDFRSPDDSVYTRVSAADPAGLSNLVTLNFLKNQVFTQRLSNTTKTVPGDFPTPQAGIDYFAKFILDDNNFLDLAAGTYIIAGLDTSKIIGKLTIRGDQRSIVSLSFVDGIILTGNVNEGTGVCDLLSAGNNVQVVGGTTDPEFATAGIVIGDTIFVVDNAQANTVETINGVGLTGNLSLVNPAPGIGNPGTSITILPDRFLDLTSTMEFASPNNQITLLGFRVRFGGDTAIEVDASYLVLDHCVIDSSNFGVVVENTGVLTTQGRATIAGCAGIGLDVENNGVAYASGVSNNVILFALNNPVNIYANNGGEIQAERATTTYGNGGFLAESGATIFADNSANIGSVFGYETKFDAKISAEFAKAQAFGVSNTGFLADFGSTMDCANAIADGWGSNGFAVTRESFMDAESSTATNNFFGYKASYNSYMDANFTTANAAGNTNDYSPALSDVLGNFFAFIEFS